MKKFFLLTFVILFNSALVSCAVAQSVQVGADRFSLYLPQLEGKRVALVVNQTSCLSDNTHLLDALLEKNVNVVKILAPEHGFRGEADAGEKVGHEKDKKTGVPVVSIYGKNFKPTAVQLADVDVVIFDIQDVGARFFTYISTMHYVMEACGENNRKCIILDRPNPNDYVDGPILKPKYKSFVGMHAIPVLHGVTVGELAMLLNGEGWLKNGVKCDLQVIPVSGWKHKQPYNLPVKPSPNLPNDNAIALYPSLCFFEATNVSIGRGTDFPFEVAGGLMRKFGTFTFTPKSVSGAKNPPNLNKPCYGIDLRNSQSKGGLSLEYLLGFYKNSGQGAAFFARPQFMDLLAGTDELRLQIVAGKSETEIRNSWAKGLEEYNTIRKKYLLYQE